VGEVLKRTIITGLSILSVLITAIALGQSSGGDFKITKSTIDSGGGTSSGDNFSLTGTIGQPDANRQISTGGGFTLAGGFWASATVIDTIFKDSFESD
jgi:hypothetical protein